MRMRISAGPHDIRMVAAQHDAHCPHTPEMSHSITNVMHVSEPFVAPLP
jgi:hypothetical protein